MGGASDKKVVGVLDHRCRVVFLGAPSPGARAFHARDSGPPRAGLSRENIGICDKRRARRSFLHLPGVGTHNFFAQVLSGLTSPRLRGEVGSPQAIRVWGRRRMGGANDKKVVGILNHGCRVVFWAFLTGARAFHARDSDLSPRAGRGKNATAPRQYFPGTALRKRGEARERLHRANIFPGQPCRLRGEVGA